MQLKIGLVAVNLVSDKVVDGITKLLVKADVDRLKSVKMKSQSTKVDDAISTAWSIALNAFENGYINDCEFDTIMCKFMLRAVSTMLDKQKLGPKQKRNYQNVDEVKAVFIQSVTKDIEEGAVALDLYGWKDLDAKTIMDTMGDASNVARILRNRSPPLL